MDFMYFSRQADSLPDALDDEHSDAQTQRSLFKRTSLRPGKPPLSNRGEELDGRMEPRMESNKQAGNQVIPRQPSDSSPPLSIVNPDYHGTTSTGTNTVGGTKTQQSNTATLTASADFVFDTASPSDEISETLSGFPAYTNTASSTTAVQSTAAASSQTSVSKGSSSGLSHSQVIAIGVAAGVTVLVALIATVVLILWMRRLKRSRNDAASCKYEKELPPTPDGSNSRPTKPLHLDVMDAVRPPYAAQDANSSQQRMVQRVSIDTTVSRDFEDSNSHEEAPEPVSPLTPTFEDRPTGTETANTGGGHTDWFQDFNHPPPREPNWPFYSPG